MSSAPFTTIAMPYCSPEARAAGYENDRSYALCQALCSNPKAHTLVAEWCAAKGGGDVRLTPEGAEQIFTYRTLLQLGVLPASLPDGPTVWSDISESFHDIGAADTPPAPEPVAAQAAPIAPVKARKIIADVMAVLTECSATREGVFLPPTQLDKNLYKRVSDVLGELGGKWNRKLGGHKFADDPSDVLATVQATGSYVSPKDFGFFPTPAGLARKAADLLDLEPGMLVLEPQAGGGALARELAAVVGTENVHTAELMEKNRQDLQRQGFRVIADDFLALPPQPIYDRILMNPPFSGQADSRHVQHAARFLKPDGRLVAIMSPGFTFRESKEAKAFRELMDVAGDHHEAIPAGTFRESGTEVSTVLIAIDAARLPWNQKPVEADVDDEFELEGAGVDRPRQRCV